MIRITRKVFTDLSIFMIGLGLLIGVMFPFFVSWMGIPREYVFKPWFFVACITAGIVVGAINIRLARVVVGSRLKLLGNRMQHVTQNLDQIKEGKDINVCNAEQCMITIDSEDEIGESAQAFNSLVETLFSSMETENALSEFTHLMGSQLAVRDLTEKALHQLMEHTHSAAGAILIENDTTLEVAFSQGIRDVNKLLESDHVKKVLRNESRVQLTLPVDVQVEGVLTDFRPREVIIEPVLYKDVILGLIILASANQYATDELTRLNLFSQSLALALHNALLFDRLERLAALDSLTGIYNRRFGMTRLHEEFGRALRMNAPIGLLMMDLDHFKQVNDTYGHLTGDRVLLRLARVARSVLREGDILVRYGGEEFL
ncbi:MAG: GGDEF domain-containing protein, partial [Anaerolineaceae bacterium]|nr:GGDEF domain-containing protein [Anaerolineaceae bacterium]